MPSPLHILQILPALNEGGVERGVIDSNRELTRRGVRNTVVSAGGTHAPQIIADGGEHVTLDAKSKNPVTAWPRALALRRVLRRLKPDIIHVRSRVPGWLVRMANAPLHIPVVTTVHGFNSVSPYSAIMVRGARVICGSTFMVGWIQEKYNTPAGIIRYVPRGFDAETFNPEKIDHNFVADFKRCHGLDNAFTVLALGRITAWKGFDTLIRATALQQKIPNLKVVFVGGVQDGQEDYAQSLRTLAEELGVTGRVIFAGSQTRAAECCAAADLLVSCAFKKPETFGRSMVEALAMERPVVAARHGGALDIIKDGENGFFFTPGDAHDLAEKLQAAAARPWHGLRADALARFSLEQMVDKTLAVYRELVP